MFRPIAAAALALGLMGAPPVSAGTVPAWGQGAEVRSAQVHKAGVKVFKHKRHAHSHGKKRFHRKAHRHHRAHRHGAGFWRNGGKGRYARHHDRRHGHHKAHRAHGGHKVVKKKLLTPFGFVIVLR